MNPFIPTNHRLPGIRSFIKRSSMFRQVEKQTVRSSSELIALAKEAFLSGRLRPGDRFPAPDEISRLTGATVAESLDAVTVLLKTKAIRQLPSGHLAIARHSVS
ncbi:hypothetical protein V2O64_16290 [Verrucomicrobiaceae bacterium 227]